MIQRISFSLIIILVIVASMTVPVQAASGPDSSKPATPIQHLVIVMQENHTFDNYFGTYPGVDGLPSGVKMPVDPANPSAGFVAPWHIGNSTITDLSHSAATFKAQYANGSMNAFVSALNTRNQDGKLTMGYYDGTDIPYYWNLAGNYVLFDEFFSSAKDGSFPNHMFWVAAAPPNPPKGQTLSQWLANVPTIFDRLQAAGVSWKFYVQNYDPSLTYHNAATAGNRESQVIWVPLLNFDRFIDDPTLSSHIVDLSQYYVDLANGTLPAVSYIVPSGASEHPPSSLASGQKFVKTLVQELMRSSAWDSSAFMLAYDDWGGWYDHVIPPQVDAYGYGLRVPVILVSPYAKKGYVDSTVLDFTSMLKFIEQNWGIAPLTARDANANNFLSAFDFNQAPRPAQFVSSTLASTATPKKDPSKIIAVAYGLASTVSFLMIGLAIFRSRRTKSNGIKEIKRK